jgi:hypothetical protein
MRVLVDSGSSDLASSNGQHHEHEDARDEGIIIFTDIDPTTRRPIETSDAASFIVESNENRSKDRWTQQPVRTS